MFLETGVSFLNIQFLDRCVQKHAYCETIDRNTRGKANVSFANFLGLGESSASVIIRGFWDGHHINPFVHSLTDDFIKSIPRTPLEGVPRVQHCMCKRTAFKSTIQPETISHYGTVAINDGVLAPVILVKSIMVGVFLQTDISMGVETLENKLNKYGVQNMVLAVQAFLSQSSH